MAREITFRRYAPAATATIGPRSCAATDRPKQAARHWGVPTQYSLASSFASMHSASAKMSQRKTWYRWRVPLALGYRWRLRRDGSEGLPAAESAAPPKGPQCHVGRRRNDRERHAIRQQCLAACRTCDDSAATAGQRSRSRRFLLAYSRYARRNRQDLASLSHRFAIEHPSPTGCQMEAILLGIYVFFV